ADRHHPLNVAGFSVVFSSLLLLGATCIYFHGFQPYWNWSKKMVAMKIPFYYFTESLGTFIKRLHSIWSVAPTSNYVMAGLALCIIAPLAVLFLFANKRPLGELELAGILCLLPSLAPGFRPYYLTVLILPFLTAWRSLTLIPGIQAAYRRVLFGILIVIF